MIIQSCHRSGKPGKVREIEVGHGKSGKVREKYKKVWNFEICLQFP